MSTFRSCSRCGHTPVVNSRGEPIDVHHCRYSQAVNALIPLAEAAADRSFEFYDKEHPHRKLSVGVDIMSDDYEAVRTDEEVWDGMFHRAMERLREQAGVPLRRGLNG